MASFPIAHAVAKHWWAVALRGVCAILFGLMAFVWPGLTLAALVILYGAYAFSDGIFAIVAGARGGLWGLVLAGMVGVAAGIIALFWPGITALVLLYTIAFWSIAQGVSEIVAAIALRKEIEDEWLLGLAGALSIGFGASIAAFPGAGALSLVWVIGTFSILLGVILIGLAFRLRGLPGRLHQAFAR